MERSLQPAGVHRLAANTRQFDAYCDGIFDHRRHLDDVERAYLEHAFAVIPPAIADDAPISWKTYGHKIVGDRIVAWQLGIGFETLAHDDVRALETVLARWLGTDSLTPYRDLLTSSQGAGLGWVFPAGQRRLYFLFAQSPGTVAQAIHHPGLAPISRPEILVGYTFDDSHLVESKVYYYPLRSHWEPLLETYAADRQQARALAAESIRLAVVVSREGEPRLQFDISPQRRRQALAALGKPAGIELAGRCARLVPPLSLDTIGVTAGGASLYFD